KPGMAQIEILAILTASIAAAHWLGNKPGGRMVGGALLVIILVAVLANFGVVPLASENVPVYNQLLGTAAPVSIFLLLLNARLASLLSAGGPMLAMFAFAALGTICGVLAAGWLLGASEWMGQWYGPLSGMFAATYIGGGANFNALALHYDFMQSGNLYAAAAVADHVLTVVWIAVLLVFPRLVGVLLPKRDALTDAESRTESVGHTDDRPALGDMVMLAALGLVAFVVSEQLAAWLGALLGIDVPAILILTTLALLLAQTGPVARLRGAEVLGMYGAYLFLAALAAYCEVAALHETGRIGLLLMAFVVILIAVHGTIIVLAARFMRQSPEVAAVASATTVGGSTVVLPLVERFGRKDLLLPGIVLGSLGNLLGTYIGFTLVYALQL
ncbi:MAG TPA: DUF819 family protein, partial [Wenzhouxiangellaceae bacterium]|nr:DUF819 family protein [Wenzhouxiangellaceae bacterium]